MSNQHATYKVFFGFQKEPFSQNVRVEDMMKSAALIGVKERFLYAVGLCAALVITGDVGSGKSSGLRFASSLLHPSFSRASCRAKELIQVASMPM